MLPMRVMGLPPIVDSNVGTTRRHRPTTHPYPAPPGALPEATSMFPHPQTLITVRSIEREQLLAQVARERLGASGLPRRSRAPRAPFVRRAARAVMSLLP